MQLSFRLWVDVLTLTVGATSSLYIESLKFFKKKKVSEASEELRSPLDALQAFSEETLPAVSALRLSGNLIPMSQQSEKEEEE